MSKKVIVAHPEKQHSYRLAEALYEADLLEEYITTVYYKKSNFTGLFDKITKNRVKLDKIRKMSFLDDKFIKQYCEWRGLLLLILRRSPLKRLVNLVQKINFDAFGRKVASRALTKDVHAVVMYDTNSLSCFNRLAKSKVIRIMDTSIANRAYTKHIYESLIKNKDEWKHFSEKDILLDKHEMRRLIDEINLTDHFLVPSNFVKKSLEFSGVAPEKIHIVPYGVDPDLFCYTDRRADISEGALELLFVGECSYRKGINYLLEAAKGMPNVVNLTVVGGYQNIQDLYTEYKETSNIKFLGRINHDKLPEIYAKADVFVLPSLSEGMSLVGLEAMATGLPLLCSRNCGVNDVVEENKNGWILDSISAMGIVEALNKINDERANIPQMGMAARKTAEKYTWDFYKKNMIKTIYEILGE